MSNGCWTLGRQRQEADSALFPEGAWACHVEGTGLKTREEGPSLQPSAMQAAPGDTPAALESLTCTKPWVSPTGQGEPAWGRSGHWAQDTEGAGKRAR